MLAACSTQPRPALLGCDLGTRTANVNVSGGDVSQETIVTFTNRKPVRQGTLEVCKIAGLYTPLGLGFPMDIKQPDGTIKRVYVPAGAAPKGTCVTIGKYPVGTKLNVADQQSYYYLWYESGLRSGQQPGDRLSPGGQLRQPLGELRRRHQRGQDDGGLQERLPVPRLGSRASADPSVAIGPARRHDGPMRTRRGRA